MLFTHICVSLVSFSLHHHRPAPPHVRHTVGRGEDGTLAHVYKSVTHGGKFDAPPAQSSGQVERVVGQQPPSDFADINALWTSVRDDTPDWEGWKRNVFDKKLNFLNHMAYLAACTMATESDSFDKNFYLAIPTTLADGRGLTIGWDSDSSWGGHWSGTFWRCLLSVSKLTPLCSRPQLDAVRVQ